MDDPQLLLQQLVAQVQALYDSTPGSAPQREADKWLTGLVGLEGAWPVLLRVVGPAAGSGQASPFDVRLTFIAAKIMQVRFMWRGVASLEYFVVLDAPRYVHTYGRRPLHNPRNQNRHPHRH
jgi:hypothetical protein